MCLRNNIRNYLLIFWPPHASTNTCTCTWICICICIYKHSTHIHSLQWTKVKKYNTLWCLCITDIYTQKNHRSSGVVVICSLSIKMIGSVYRHSLILPTESWYDAIVSSLLVSSELLSMSFVNCGAIWSLRVVLFWQIVLTYCSPSTRYSYFPRIIAMMRRLWVSWRPFLAYTVHGQTSGYIRAQLHLYPTCMLQGNNSLYLWQVLTHLFITSF